MPTKRSAFTLIELLVVIAIVAVLAVVVILTLNPAELLRQTRDTARLSDMANMNSAIALFQTDTAGGSLGTASTTYLSLVDPAATSTAGTNCAGVTGLPSAPTNWNWHCAASSTLKMTNGQTGWLPVNFTAISSGSPLATLPTDPTNSSSSGFWYTYTSIGTQWQQTAQLEAQKNAATELQSSGNPTYATGSNPQLAPFAGGLVGWWKFDETGTTALDSSGSGNAGTMYVATSTVGDIHASTSSCKLGGCGTFDGTNSYVKALNSASFTFGTTGFTYTAWIKPSGFPNPYNMFMGHMLPYFNVNGLHVLHLSISAGVQRNAYGATVLTAGQWYFAAGTYDSSGMMKVYLNGALDGSAGTFPLIDNNANDQFIGAWNPDMTYKFAGIIDDVRIYNRALSAAEIQALYNATK